MTTRHRLTVRLDGRSAIEIETPVRHYEVITQGAQGPAGVLPPETLAQIENNAALVQQASDDAQATRAALDALVGELTHVFQHTAGRTEAMS